MRNSFRLKWGSNRSPSDCEPSNLINLPLDQNGNSTIAVISIENNQDFQWALKDFEKLKKSRNSLFIFDKEIGQMI